MPGRHVQFAQAVLLSRVQSRRQPHHVSSPATDDFLDFLYRLRTNAARLDCYGDCLLPYAQPLSHCSSARTSRQVRGLDGAVHVQRLCAGIQSSPQHSGTLFQGRYQSILVNQRRVPAPSVPLHPHQSGKRRLCAAAGTLAILELCRLGSVSAHGREIDRSFVNKFFGSVDRYRTLCCRLDRAQAPARSASRTTYPTLEASE